MDLIERLLNAARGEDGLASNVPNALIREAAAALEALQAEVERLREALEQGKGSGYWPEMPKNGGPDWTGFDG